MINMQYIYYIICAKIRIKKSSFNRIQSINKIDAFEKKNVTPLEINISVRSCYIHTIYISKTSTRKHSN